MINNNNKFLEVQKLQSEILDNSGPFFDQEGRFLKWGIRKATATKNVNNKTIKFVSPRSDSNDCVIQCLAWQLRYESDRKRLLEIAAVKLAGQRGLDPALIAGSFVTVQLADVCNGIVKDTALVFLDTQDKTLKHCVLFLGRDYRVHKLTLDTVLRRLGWKNIPKPRKTDSDDARRTRLNKMTKEQLIDELMRRPAYLVGGNSNSIIRQPKEKVEADSHLNKTAITMSDIEIIGMYDGVVKSHLTDNGNPRPLITWNNFTRSWNQELQGNFHSNFIKFINKTGLRITNEQLKKSVSCHGGHPEMRTITNALQVLSLSEMQKDIVNYVQLNPENRAILYDVGSKISTFNQLTRAFTHDPDKIISLKVPHIVRQDWMNIPSPRRSQFSLIDDELQSFYNNLQNIILEKQAGGSEEVIARIRHAVQQIAVRRHQLRQDGNTLLIDDDNVDADDVQARVNVILDLLNLSLFRIDRLPRGNALEEGMCAILKGAQMKVTLNALLCKYRPPWVAEAVEDEQSILSMNRRIKVIGFRPSEEDDEERAEYNRIHNNGVAQTRADSHYWRNNTFEKQYLDVHDIHSRWVDPFGPEINRDTYTRRFWYMNDVHYYLAKNKINLDTAQWKNGDQDIELLVDGVKRSDLYQDMFYISGLSFPSMPGQYVLPWGNGQMSLKVDKSSVTAESDEALLEVCQMSSGSGRPYVHPAVYMTETDTLISLGWIRFIQTRKISLKNFYDSLHIWKIKKYVQCQGSPQRNFFDSFCEKQEFKSKICHPFQALDRLNLLEHKIKAIALIDGKDLTTHRRASLKLLPASRLGMLLNKKTTYQLDLEIWSNEYQATMSWLFGFIAKCSVFKVRIDNGEYVNVPISKPQYVEHIVKFELITNEMLWGLIKRTSFIEKTSTVKYWNSLEEEKVSSLAESHRALVGGFTTKYKEKKEKNNKKKQNNEQPILKTSSDAFFLEKTDCPEKTFVGGLLHRPMILRVLDAPLKESMLLSKKKITVKEKVQIYREHEMFVQKRIIQLKKKKERIITTSLNNAVRKTHQELNVSYKKMIQKIEEYNKNVHRLSKMQLLKKLKIMEYDIADQKMMEAILSQKPMMHIKAKALDYEWNLPKYDANIRSMTIPQIKTLGRKIRIDDINKVQEVPNSYYKIKPVKDTVMQMYKPGQENFKIPYFQSKDKAYVEKMYAFGRRILNDDASRVMKRTSRLYMSKSGPTIYNNDNEVVEQYEWDATSDNNKICGLFQRHILPRIAPSGPVVQDFKKYTERWFQQWFQKFTKKITQEIKDMPDSAFDWQKWVEDHDAWTDAKKAKYTEVIYRQIYGSEEPRNRKYIDEYFKTMVKTGETYYGSNLKYDSKNRLVDRKDRPREIKIASKCSAGLATYVQSFIWKPLKHALPGFIQGMNSKEMSALFQETDEDDRVWISWDGSAYDSTQYKCLIECVDDRFWTKSKGWLSLLFSRLGIKNPEDVTKDYINDMKKKDAVFFMPLNNAYSNPPEWTPYIIKQYLKGLSVGDLKVSDQLSKRLIELADEKWGTHKDMKIGKKNVRHCWIYNLLNKSDMKAKGLRDDLIKWGQQNYLATPVSGTTFSGHPTRTTLGNTLRSLAYADYYAHCIKIDPQSSKVSKGLKLFRAYASGDDVMCAVNKKYALAYKAKLIELTCNKKDSYECRGLGQCVPEEDIKMGTITDMDFCSKTFYKVEGQIVMTRDVKKLLSTKNIYIGENVFLGRYGYSHAKAILNGVKAEKISHNLEFILTARCHFLWQSMSPEDRLKYTEHATGDDAELIATYEEGLANYSHRYLKNTGKGYLAEDQVDDAYGLDIQKEFAILKYNVLQME